MGLLLRRQEALAQLDKELRQLLEVSRIQPRLVLLWAKGLFVICLNANLLRCTSPPMDDMFSAPMADNSTAGDRAR